MSYQLAGHLNITGLQLPPDMGASGPLSRIRGIAGEIRARQPAAGGVS